MIKPREALCIDCTDSKHRKVMAKRCIESPYHYQKHKADQQRAKQKEKPLKAIKRSPIKKKYKPTGELALFMKIYVERRGLCEITKQPIKFDVSCFAHILSKGAYPSLRLDPENIIMVQKNIHTLYDDRGQEELLEAYPGAIIIYDKKDELRRRYYQNLP